MPTKERDKEKEEWIVASEGPLGVSTSTVSVQRKDKITYTATRPPYVSFNTCSHTRGYPSVGHLLRVPTSPIAEGVIAKPVGGGVGELPYSIEKTSALTYAYSQPSSRRSISASDYEARVYDAVLAAYAQARSIPSILQPVIELKDIKQTTRQAAELAKWLMSRPSSVRQYIRKGYTFGHVVHDFLRSITEKSSNAYLMSTFGILPTVGDTARIARSVADPSRFVKARSNVVPKNTVLKAAFHCLPGKPPFDLAPRIRIRTFRHTVGYDAPHWNGLDSTRHIDREALATLGGDRWYDVTDVHGLVFIKARVHTSVDNSLLNDWNYTQTPGAILWELVPFSFMVDWFYNVGDQLQRAEKRSNVYRRVRISDFSEPWVCTHRDRYTLSASCESRSTLKNIRAWGRGSPYWDKYISGTIQQTIIRKALKTYISREFERGPWQGHLYDLPRQEFSVPVRPYQVAASLALLAQNLCRLGRN